MMVEGSTLKQRVSGNPALKMEHWQRPPGGGDDCEVGGEQFDRLISESAQHQRDGQPLAQLTYERQQQQPEVLILNCSLLCTRLLERMKFWGKSCLPNMSLSLPSTSATASSWRS